MVLSSRSKVTLQFESTSAETEANSDASNNAEANASAAPDTPAQNTASPGGASTNSTAAQATPSSSLVGTNLAEDLSNMAAPSASNITGTTPMADTADMGTMTGTATDGDSETAAVTSRPQMQQAEPDQRLTNGKIPDDIPDADNDSVFEAQIRAAAMAETDPDTQKNLWNEYRRYKGLPEKE